MQSYLPSIEKFPVTLTAIQYCKASIDDFDDIVVATPSSGFKKIILELRDCILPHQNIISATKGFCHDTYALLSEIDPVLITSIFSEGSSPNLITDPLPKDLSNLSKVALSAFNFSSLISSIFINFIQTSTTTT